MTSDRNKSPGIYPGGEFPYFTIQYWDEGAGIWIDIHRRFSSKQELIDFARDNLAMDLDTRIAVSEGLDRYRICRSIDAFGIRTGD